MNHHEKELIIEDIHLCIINDNKSSQKFMSWLEKTNYECGFHQYRNQFYCLIINICDYPDLSEELSAMIFNRTKNYYQEETRLQTDMSLEQQQSDIINSLENATRSFKNVLKNLPKTLTTKENIMSEIPAIETKTYIFGDLSTDLSDQQIFDVIKSLEDEVVKLSKIENQPKKLEKKIKDIKEDIVALVEFVDSRKP